MDKKCFLLGGRGTSRAESVRFLAHVLTVCVMLAAGTLAVSKAAQGAEPPVARSLRDQIPRVPPTEPADVAKTFRVLDGFRMDLIAAEPLVTDPVAMAYDEQGRAFVVEMSDYPYTDKSTDVPFKERTTDLPIGRVRLLEDTDGDGKFDKGTIYAEKLSWPTGIALYRGGCFVAATPDIWYFKDTDGDGRADVRKRVFTGFRKFNVQAVMNNLAWGPDQWIYGAGSSNGGAILALDKPSEKAVPLSRNDYRFEPVSGKFEVISGGARFGNSFDNWGNRFICNIRNPAQHVLLQSRYLARNPYLVVASALNDVAEAGDNLPVFRSSPPEPWRAVRAERWASEANQKYPRSETAAEGFVTSSSGITVYRGDAYPAKYHGNLFLGEVAGNLVHRQTLTPSGVTFIARRADPNTEFVTSTDNWFRPVNFVNAPDGTLHVLDMYRETIEHPWSIPDDIKALVDLESGRDRGRIYRLSPPGFNVPAPPGLAKASSVELVALLENRNSWWRETAQRLLFERQDAESVDPLRTLLHGSEYPLARWHALWTLSGLNALTDADLSQALRDQASGMRESGVLLAEPRLKDRPELLEQVLAMADDAEIRVRFQVALTLGEAKDGRTVPALNKIIRRDASDPWMRIAVLSSLADGAAESLLDLLGDPAFAAVEPGLTITRQLASVVGAQDRQNQPRKVLESVAALSQGDQSRAIQRNIMIGLGEGLKRGRKQLASLVTDLASPAGRLLAELLAEARTAALDTRRDLASREQAIQILTFGAFEQTKATLQALTDARQPQEVQMAAVRGIGGYPDDEVVGLLLAAWPGYTPALRGEVVEAIMSRASRIGPLLDAVAAGTVPRSYISPARRSLLVIHRDPLIQTQAKKLFSGDVASPRKEVIAQYQAALSMSGDRARGQKVAERECLTCHRVGEKGHDVGPNFATIRHRTPEEVLTHLLDPNREVPPNFMQYVVAVDDGRVATGMIASETATSITLKRAENVQETILRQNIEQISSTGTSLMPEGMEKKLSLQDAADLLSFLLGR
jgi:putative membrane-bound dehydrogenase-like protein